MRVIPSTCAASSRALPWEADAKGYASGVLLAAASLFGEVAADLHLGALAPRAYRMGCENPFLDKRLGCLRQPLPRQRERASRVGTRGL